MPYRDKEQARIASVERMRRKRQGVTSGVTSEGVTGQGVTSIITRAWHSQLPFLRHADGHWMTLDQVLQASARAGRRN